MKTLSIIIATAGLVATSITGVLWAEERYQKITEAQVTQQQNIELINDLALSSKLRFVQDDHRMVREEILRVESALKQDPENFELNRRLRELHSDEEFLREQIKTLRSEATIKSRLPESPTIHGY